METCMEEVFSLYRKAVHSQWVQETAATENSDHLSFGAGMPAVGHASAPEFQQQPTVVTSPPNIEDEETRQGPLTDVSGEASTRDKEVHATVPIFREPIPGDDTSPSAYPPQRKMSVDAFSNTTAPQAPTIDYYSQPYPFPSTSSFNPYAEHGSQRAWEFSMQPHYIPDTTIGDDSDDSSECEQPTDLSVPKGNHDVENHKDTESDDSDDSDDDTTQQPSNQKQHGSSVRGPTYTHLSDVSNDSVDDARGNKQPTASYPNFRTKKQAENDFIPPLPHYDFRFTGQLLTLNDIEQLAEYFHTASYYVPPDRLKSYFQSLIRSLPNEEVRLFIHFMLKSVPSKKIKLLILWWQGELKDFPDLRNEQDVISELDGSNDEQQSRIQQQEIASDEYEVIDLTNDDEEAADEEEMQRPVAQPHVGQVQCGEPRAMAMYSLPETHSPLGAESFTPPEQPSPRPAQAFTLPTQLNEAGMQSATSSEEPTVNPPPPRSPMELSSPQPFPFLPTVQNRTTEEPDELREMTQIPSADFSGLPVELSSEDYPMEPLFVAEPPVPFPASVPGEPEPMPGTSQSHQASPSPCQSPTQQSADEEHAGPSGRRSREPWDHKGLMSFVALNAFTLPRHVWIERKEGQPRRSLRIAKKQVKIYFLRERVSSKDAPEKRKG